MHSSMVFVKIVSAVYSLFQLLRSLLSPSRSAKLDLEQGQQTLDIASQEPARIVPSVSWVSVRSCSSSFHCQDLGFTASVPPDLHHTVQPSEGVQSSLDSDQPQQDVAHTVCLPSALATRNIDASDGSNAMSSICSQKPSHSRSNVGEAGSGQGEYYS